MADPAAARVAWHISCLDALCTTGVAQAQQPASASALAPMLSPGETLHMRRTHHLAEKRAEHTASRLPCIVKAVDGLMNFILPYVVRQQSSRAAIRHSQRRTSLTR